MKVLKVFLLVIVVLILSVVIIASTRPSDFKVERHVLIKTTPDKVYPYISDLKKFSEWNPFEKKDPKIKKTFIGKDSGVGSIYEWEGNSEVGKGQMEIKEVVTNSKVIYELRFEKPMKGTNIAEFNLSQENKNNENLTKISWSMTGKNNIISKIICLFINFDKMVGGDFQKGLENLKNIIEIKKI